LGNCLLIWKGQNDILCMFENLPKSRSYKTLPNSPNEFKTTAPGTPGAPIQRKHSQRFDVRDAGTCMTCQLMAIGGALSLEGDVLRSFLERSGGRAARVVILPTASGLPAAGEEYRAALKNLGMRQEAQILPVRQRTDASRPEIVEAVRSATGIFITGGNQVRLTVFLSGTPVHHALLEGYRTGVMVAGTSAGAAALAELMIAYGKNGNQPRQGQAQLLPGLGFLPGILFDQHFRQRARLGRLMMAMAANPALLGIGVDEDTAALIVGNLLKVVGRNAVTILDGAEMLSSNISEAPLRSLIALSGIRYHLLTAGCTFDLAQRAAQIPFE
jgi:cyanophycinase